MEDEFDLRPYVVALFRRWQLILSLTLILGLLAAGTSLLSSQRSQATASVLIIPSTSQVALDPRFVTRDATLLTNATFQRQALLSLATSVTLERQVADELSLPTPNSGTLASQINVDTDGDLLQITASGADDAAALALAEAWGRSYEQLVAKSYSRDAAGLALIDEQITAAQTRYSEAQTELEQFLGTSDTIQLQQQVVSLEGLLNGSSEAGTIRYTQYLTRVQELDLILSDARALRAQVAEGQSDGLANRLSVLALRARAAGEEVPVQLQVADATELTLDDEAALADLDGFIVVLEEQRDRLGAEAERLAAEIAEGNTSASGLDPTSRNRYETDLASLRGRLAQLEGQQRALEQTRDIALSSLEILQRKRDEQQIAETTPLISVRFISASVSPPGSRVLQMAPRTVLGLLVGALIGMGIALWLEIGRARLAKLTGSPAPAERPADKPVAAP